MEEILTLQKLRSMRPNTIFKTGLAIDGPGGINMTNSGKLLRWVAITGAVNDWCIYCHWHYYPPEFIARFGDKIINEKDIVRLVPADYYALNMYRP